MLECALAIDHLAWAAKHAEKVLEAAQGPQRPGDGQPGGVRRVPAARRRRRHRAVELPGLHADGLDRLRARRRQRRRLQAQRVHARASASGWPGRSSSRSGDPSCRSSRATARPVPRCAAAGVDKVAFTGSTATGKKVMAACAETLTPVVIEAGGKDAAPRRRRRRHRGRRRRRALGRLRQRRPDLHRRRAGLRPRAGLRRVPRRARRQGQGPARRRRAGLADRPDHDAQPARRHPPAHPRRDRPRRPGRARRRRRGGGAVRAADDPGRRTRGLARRCRRRPSARP